MEEQPAAAEADAVAETHEAPGADGAGTDAAGEDVRAAEPAPAASPAAVAAEAADESEAARADAPGAASGGTDADEPEVIAARDGLAPDRVAADVGGEALEAEPAVSAATAAASAAAVEPDLEDGRIEPVFDVSGSESKSGAEPEVAAVEPEPTESAPEDVMAGEPAGEAAFSPAVPQPKSDLTPKFATDAPEETKPSFDAALEDVKPGADIAAEKAEGDAAASGEETTAAGAPAVEAPAFAPQASSAGSASGAALGAAAGAGFSAGARPAEAAPAARGDGKPGWLKSLWPGPLRGRLRGGAKPSKAKSAARSAPPPPPPPRQETPAQFVRTARRTRVIQLAVVTCLVVLAAVYGRSWLKTAGFLTSGIEVQASTNWTNLPVDPAVFSDGPAIISANGPFRLRVDGTVYTIVGREQVVVPIGDATTVEVRSIEQPLTVRFLPGQG
ncbi:hypothetical protein SAMN02745172_01410 [Pseudoxanthobacter soli DSM 19599]|uniref:Uncharacterized protein n=1 Tax=Pseudoxanthobacter soli DSM 19599 TaxID=1123029 RepID=A0A1M7ZF67_9HYPH|nr:hypothetical protein [Pseudoxanthobacter soli]SHO63513.1 hypothetical protein SAMN02745172_01410 [Pseudoxanthobacter soli DSM 19599]